MNADVLVIVVVLMIVLLFLIFLGNYGEININLDLTVVETFESQSYLSGTKTNWENSRFLPTF